MNKNLLPDFILDNFPKNKLHGKLHCYSVFMDISGFTVLTEELMKKGTEGAEVLAEILKNLFEPIVNKIYSYGGFITNFLGDAVIVIFDSDICSKEQMLSCLWMIKDELTNIETQDTKFGKFKLSFKTGAAFGEAEWAIVGTENMSYYFKGDSIQRSVEAQNYSNAKEIIISESIASILDKKKFELEKISDGYYKLKSLHKIFPSTFKKRKLLSNITSQLFTKKFIPEAILDYKGKGEFREVVSVFLSSEESINLTNIFFEIVINAVEKYSGYLHSIEYSDKGCVILICFGAPIHFEDDALRAINALKLIFENAGKINLKAGISKGKVFAGIIGSHKRMQYSILGGDVNLGARLMSISNWKEIIVSEKVYDELRDKFDFEKLISKKLKGFENEKEFYKLKLKSKEFTDKEFYDKEFFAGQLFGRKDELEKIYSAVSKIFNDEPSGVILVNGEAGIGKSRLVSEFKKKILTNYESSFTWFNSTCNRIINKSLHPFIYALKNIIGINDNQSDEIKKKNFQIYLNELAVRLKKSDFKDKEIIEFIESELNRTHSILGSLLDLYWENSLYEQLEPKMRFENIQLTLYFFFLAHSLINPVIVEIEDLHWIDSDSMKFVELLLKNIEEFPFSIIITSRAFESEEQIKKIKSLVTKDLHQTIDLNYLTENSIKEMTEHILNSKISKDLINFISEKTDGNPYFVEQLVLYLKEVNNLKLDDSEESLTLNFDKSKLEDLPSGIKGILLSRLDKLSSEVKEVVQTASIIGREFEVNILSEMLKGDEALNYKIKNAEEKKIWYLLNEMKYIFKHSLLRDVAYEMQLKSRLRELHLLAANAIETMHKGILTLSKKEEYSYHFGIGNNFIDDKKNIVLTKDMLSDENLKIRLEKFISIIKDLSDYYIKEYKNTDALEKLNLIIKLSEVTDDKRIIIESLIKKFDILHRIGESNECIACTKLAISLSEEIADKESIIQSKLTQGYVLGERGEFDSSFEKLDYAMKLSEEIQNKELILKSLISFAQHYLRKYDYKNSDNYYNKTIELAAELGRKRELAKSYNNLGISYLDRGDALNAHKSFLESYKIAKENNFIEQLINSTGNLAVFQMNKFDYKSALEYMKKCLSLAEEIGDKKNISIATSNIGYIYFLIDDLDQAEKYLKKSVFIDERLGLKFHLPLVLNNLGQLEIKKGNYKEAKKYSNRALLISKESKNSLVESEVLSLLGYIHLFLEDFEIAEKYFNEALSLSKKQKFLLVEITTLFLLGYLCNEKILFEKALEFYNEALSYNSKAQSLTIAADILSNKLDTLFKLNKLDEIPEAINEGLQISKEINHSKYIFKFILLKNKFEAISDKENARENFLKMLIAELKEENIAEINYELYRLTGEEKFKKDALDIFKKLFKVFPKYEFNKRIRELSTK